MTRRRRFTLPREGPSHPGWGIASALLHGVLAVLLLVYSGPTFQRTVVTFIDIGGGDPRQVDLPAVGGAPGGRNDGAGRPLESRDVELVAPTETPSAVPPIRREELAGGGVPPADSVQPVARRAGRRILGPRVADGRVWIRPRDAIAAAIAAAIDGEEPFDSARHIERLDSAIAQRIYVFLDSMMTTDSMDAARPPSWTTEIDGQTWGIDSQWIHLGSFKLPTMILGLLPLPQGNYEQAQHAAELQRIREDIMRAAQRAETADQFRRYVNELRERRDAEREEERNRRTVPRDSVKT